MTEIWVAGAVVAAGVGFFLGRRAVRHTPDEPVMTEREQHLAKHVATRARCTIYEALPAVRNELALAPHQDDETLVKRATYHFQMALPEHTCTTYRDSAKG